LTGKDTKDTEPTIKIEAFTPHDLRRTAATQIAKLGFGAFVDKVLNHTDTRVTAIYDRYDYDKEKQKALQAWDRKLIAIVTDKKSDNVVPMVRKGA
jgi:integrase